MADIGRRIYERRKALKLTQEELAAKMGYKSKSTINKIEMGINDIPQSKVVRFAEVLDTSVGYLMGWEKVEQKNDILSDAVIKMRTNDVFLSLVTTLYQLNDKQLAKAAKILHAFFEDLED